MCSFKMHFSLLMREISTDFSNTLHNRRQLLVQKQQKDMSLFLDETTHTQCRDSIYQKNKDSSFC